jgi:predicted ATP-grasp superfamily ATP-dependent carboligase
VVAEVGWVNGLAAVRSLGRAGLRVVAVDHRPWALGLRSRYAEPYYCPEPLEDEEGFVRGLAELGERLGGPVPIFPTHDEHLNALARNAGALGELYRFPFPPWETLELVQSKRHQLERAAEIGVPVPRTEHPRSPEEAKAAAAELGYPIFLKPSDPLVFKQRYKRQAFMCHTWAELEQAYEHMAPYEPMVQEFVPGGDDGLYTLGSYIGADGEVLGLFCGRKLRQTLHLMGSARVGVAVWVDEVVEQGLGLLRALGFHGISQVEFKVDPRDGRYKLIEVNPRLWQWHGLAAACGVDLPWIAYCDLLGRRLPPQTMRDEGKRWSITFMAGLTPAPQRPPYVDGVFARDDLRPALTQAARFGVRTIPGLAERRTRRRKLSAANVR